MIASVDSSGRHGDVVESDVPDGVPNDGLSQQLLFVVKTRCVQVPITAT